MSRFKRSGFFVTDHMKSALILLHGAIGAASQLNPLKDVLSGTFEVYSFNFEGHGGSPSEHPFSIELFTENLHTFCPLYPVTRTGNLIISSYVISVWQDKPLQNIKPI